jgi:hypothetical protein
MESNSPARKRWMLSGSVLIVCSRFMYEYILNL